MIKDMKPEIVMKYKILLKIFGKAKFLHYFYFKVTK